MYGSFPRVSQSCKFGLLLMRDLKFTFVTDLNLGAIRVQVLEYFRCAVKFNFKFFPQLLVQKDFGKKRLLLVMKADHVVGDHSMQLRRIAHEQGGIQIFLPLFHTRITSKMGKLHYTNMKLRKIGSYLDARDASGQHKLSAGNTILASNFINLSTI
jgi:hypothetical protein